MVCDLADGLPLDMTTVAALCRLVLHARRIGIETRVRNASPELRELLSLAGLDDVIRTSD